MLLYGRRKTFCVVATLRDFFSCTFSKRDFYFRKILARAYIFNCFVTFGCCFRVGFLMDRKYQTVVWRWVRQHKVQKFPKEITELIAEFCRFCYALAPPLTYFTFPQNYALHNTQQSFNWIPRSLQNTLHSPITTQPSVYLLKSTGEKKYGHLHYAPNI